MFTTDIQNTPFKGIIEEETAAVAWGKWLLWKGPSTEVETNSYGEPDFEKHLQKVLWQVIGAFTIAVTSENKAYTEEEEEQIFE